MDNFDLEELQEMCEEYGISRSELSDLIEEALNLRVFNGETLDDSQIYEIIKLAIENYDEEITQGAPVQRFRKSPRVTVELAAHKLLDKSPYVDNYPDNDYSDEARHI